MRKFVASLLMLSAFDTFAQALLVDPTPYEGPAPAEQPGLLAPVPIVSSDLQVDIGFFIDSVQLDERIDYRCSDYVLLGHFLTDRFPSNYVGGFYMATVGNGKLCWLDAPYYDKESSWRTYAEFDVEADVCHHLTVRRSVDALTIVLDGDLVFSESPAWWQDKTWTYDSANGLIGIGREKNIDGPSVSYTQYSQWPGSISYYRENGVDLLASGKLTGGALFAENNCAERSSRHEPQQP